MFNKDRFSNILNNIATLHYNNNIAEFARSVPFDRTYASKCINKRLVSPPTPKILKKIAEASNGLTTYNELMRVCGYLDEDINISMTSDLELSPDEEELLKQILEDYKIQLENGNHFFELKPYINELPLKEQTKMQLAFNRNPFNVSSLVRKNNDKTLDVVIAEKIFEQDIDKLSKFDLDKEQLIDIKNVLVYPSDNYYSKEIQIDEYVLNTFGKNTDLYEIITNIYEDIEFTKKKLKNILTNCDKLEYDKILNLSGFNYMEFEEVEKYIDYLISKRNK